VCRLDRGSVGLRRCALRRKALPQKRSEPLALSVQPQLPVGGDTPSRSWYRLIDWMMFRRCKMRAVVELSVAIVVEPMFSRFVTRDHRMADGLCVASPVLTRGLIAASDVATRGAATQMEPPTLLLLALDTPRAAGRHSGVDDWEFAHQIPPISGNAANSVPTPRRLPREPVYPIITVRFVPAAQGPVELVADARRLFDGRKGIRQH
jgi:hypothetical protein